MFSRGPRVHHVDMTEAHPGRSLPARTTVDDVLDVAGAAAMGALASVPVIGPILREVVGTAWTELRYERVERFATQLGEDMASLGDRIDHEFVCTAEFAALTEQVLESILQRRNEEKIAAFAAALAHASTLDRPDERERLRCVDDLGALRPAQIEVLSRLAAAGSADWVRPSDVITVGQVAQSKLNLVLKGLDVDRLDLDELERRGLTRSLSDTVTLLAVANDVRAILAPRGRSFLEFITAKAAGTAPVVNPEDSSCRKTFSQEGGDLDNLVHFLARSLIGSPTLSSRTHRPTR